mmetsp:Transcript_40257/g.107976  ORF Transcript_40257/g.107976 Transcript_40257/m.107976 type:complete len:90 (-) Transcript_40257:255-524(-)
MESDHFDDGVDAGPERGKAASAATIPGGRCDGPPRIEPKAKPIDYGGRFDDIVDDAEAEVVQDFILAGLFGSPAEAATRTDLPPEPDLD